jgi:hypothetical protein
MAKMGLKDFIPAPSRPKRAAKSGSSKKHKPKRQKTEDGEVYEEDDIDNIQPSNSQSETIFGLANAQTVNTRA